MRVSLAAGWRITHLTDRCLELTKDDYAYRRLTGGRDGFVRVRAEPGMDRAAMFAKAEQMARANDEALTFRVANDLIPRDSALRRYRRQQRQLATAFGTPEDAEIIGRKRA